MTKLPLSSLHIDFIEYCKKLEDHRDPVKRIYSLEEILFLSLCGIISGCEGWSEISYFGEHHIQFLRNYLPYTNGIPCSKTVSRVFGVISPAVFEDFFIDWFGQIFSNNLPGKSIIAIDGKTVCGSKSKNKRALHILHAYAAESGLLLGYKTTDAKSNEITAIPLLLEKLDIKNSIITLDAMGCQRDICSKIKEDEGEYVIGLKGNQGLLNKDVRLLLNDLKEIDQPSIHTCVDAGHGRVEERRVTAIAAGAHLKEVHKWPGLKSVAMVTTSRYNKSKKTYDKEESRYYISSLEPDAAKLQYSIRKHWAVESAHWSLDVSFNEDNINIVMDNASENLAFLRRVALNMMKIYQTSLTKKVGIKQLQKKCLMSPQTIGEIISANLT